MKPDNYPLPWCEKLNAPYWAINMAWCAIKPGWSGRQAYKPMSEIIPWIDEELERSN